MIQIANDDQSQESSGTHGDGGSAVIRKPKKIIVQSKVAGIFLRVNHLPNWRSGTCEKLGRVKRRIFRPACAGSLTSAVGQPFINLLRFT